MSLQSWKLSACFCDLTDQVMANGSVPFFRKTSPILRKPLKEGAAAADTVDGNNLVFQRLAQGLEGCVIELGQFVQEKHTPVAHGDLAEPERPAAAD